MNSFYVVQSPRLRVSYLAAAMALGVALSGLPIGATAQRGTTQQAAVGPDSEALAEYKDRLDRYVAIHQKLEKSLPPLPEEATAQQLTDRQQALMKQIVASRKDAKVGDVFTPAMQTYVKRLMAKLFAGPAGAQLRASIMDENPVSIKLAPNMPYPTKVPLSTMPPAVLEGLPKPPEQLEYRFIGDDLILLDVHAQMIVDFVSQALPK